MSESTSWSDAIELLKPHVVKVHTPQASGTGYLIAHAKSKNLSGIATAAHVIAHAHQWEQPIRVEHFQSGQSLLVRHHERAVLLEQRHDTAAIVFDRQAMPLPSEPLPLIPEGYILKVGVEAGWLGFPQIAPNSLCFFSGRISCWQEESRAYLVDGVAINGVSGGPTFQLVADGVVVIGVVSAYLPNQTLSGTLPGLCVIRDVKQFQELIPKFKSLDEAKAEEPVVPQVEQPASEPKGGV